MFFVKPIIALTDFKTKIMRPQKANPEDYEEFGLKPGKGGMRVKIQLSKDNSRVTVPHHDTLCKVLQRHFALREILQRRDVIVVDSNRNQDTLIRYTPPDGELILDDRLDFDPPYEGASASLKLYLSPIELPTDLNEGILVCDEFACHQVTRFAQDLDQDPIARKIFGTLKCKHVRRLQLEFERFRERNEKKPEHNPIDIVDPNRRVGFDRDHPFVKKLFGWAEDRLRREVERLRGKLGGQQREVADKETKRRLRDLAKAVSNYLKRRMDEEIFAPATPEDRERLFKEGVLLNPPFDRIAVGEKKRLGYTVISLGEDEDPSHVEVAISGEGLRIDPKNPLLKPQRRNPERLSAYFDIEGERVADAITLTVHHSSELIPPVSRVLEVVEPEDPYAKLSHEVSFERQNYTVHDNGTRTLVFHAKGRRFRSVDWTSKELVESSTDEFISILQGKTLRVESIGNDLWRGEVYVRGRGMGKRATITLSVPTEEGCETTTTTVRVAEKEQPSGSVQIEIVPEPGGQWRAQWDRENPNRLIVFAPHPALERYLGRNEEGFPGQKLPHVRILLAEIVAEKVVERVLQEKIVHNPALFQSDPNALFFLLSEEMTTFLPIAHKIMISDEEASGLVVGEGNR